MKDNYEDMAGIFKKKMGEMKPSDETAEPESEEGDSFTGPTTDDNRKTAFTGPTTDDNRKTSPAEKKLLGQVQAMVETSPSFKEELRSLLG